MPCLSESQQHCILYFHCLEMCRQTPLFVVATMLVVVSCVSVDHRAVHSDTLCSMATIADLLTVGMCMLCARHQLRSSRSPSFASE